MNKVYYNILLMIIGKDKKVIRTEVRAEKTDNLQTQTQTLFQKVPDIVGFRPYRDTEVSSARGAIVPPCFFLDSQRVSEGSLFNNNTKNMASKKDYPNLFF